MARKNKLTPAQVLEIRSSDKPAKWLAEKYGVGLNCIYDARSHKTYASLTPNQPNAELNPLLERALYNVKTGGFKGAELALLLWYMSNPANHSIYAASVALGFSEPRIATARKRLEVGGFLTVETVGHWVKVVVCYE